MRFQGKKILYKCFDTKDESIAERKRANELIDSYLEAYYAEHPDWDRDYYQRLHAIKPLL